MKAEFILRIGGIGMGVLLMLSAGCGLRSPVHSPDAARSIPEDVARHIPDYRPHDTRPYEFIWANPLPRHDHLIDFERLLGWRVETAEGASARIERCREEQLWGDFVGRLVVSNRNEKGWVRLIPPNPIVVVDPVDTLTLWTHAPDQAGHPVQESRFLCVLSDRHGEEYPIDLGPVDESGWRLLYARLPENLRLLDKYPLSVVRFEWVALPPVRNAILRLDALALFTDGLEPVRYPARPRRPLPLEEGQLLGVNTGQDTLDFPVRSTTILPAPSGSGRSGELRLQQEAEEVFVLRDAAHEEPLSFRVDAANGLALVEALWDGVETGIALHGINVPGSPAEFGRPIVIRHDRNRLYLEYSGGKIYRISVHGASLIVDLDYRGRQLARVSAGPLTLSGNFIPLKIPYLHLPQDPIPPVLLAMRSEGPLYVHMMMDVYRSNASIHFMESTGDSNHSQWKIGARYEPRTDRVRNDAHERFVVSVSSRLLNVLPDIPNPAGAHADALVARFVVHPVLPASGEAGSALDQNHGLFLTADALWRDGRESRSFRVRANPHLGGSDAVKAWFERVAAAGGRAALNLHVREISPLNEFWAPDRLLRTPGDAWQPVGPFAFAPKPVYALNWVLEHAEKLQSAYSPGAYWLESFGQSPPWVHNDYDRRVPGAATLSQTLFADGDLLQSLSSATGMPLIGDVAGARFYAGLMDGLVSMGAEATLRPYDPIYKLYRIQPLSVVFAPPFQHNMFEMDPDDPDSRAAVHDRLDRYLADQIAYGNAGRLPYPLSETDPEFRDRIVYSLLALQQRYALRQPKRILYAADDGYVTFSDAITQGSWRQSFLYVEYPGDLEVWVNGSEDRIWTLRVGREEYELPPSGWLAIAPDLFAFSGLVGEGQRMDYVEAPEYLYLNPRGQPVQFRELESVDGAAIIMTNPHPNP